ncbi:MAG: TolC family protein [Bacteroidia bacterium]|nr:TolC family protein [Bacteroidia bacterium]
MKYMIRIFIGILLFFQGFLGIAQSNLDRYIELAIQQNIALDEARLNVDRQETWVSESKAKSIPTLGFQSRYSRAGGGRSFQLAVGDLVNPAYQNLNLINEINSASLPSYPNLPLYPTIANEEVDFLRNEEQETKLSLVLPIFNSAIRENRKLQQTLLEVENRSFQLKELALIYEVRRAYYNFLKATKTSEIFDSSIILVKENIRTTNSLFRNNRVTQDQLLAAEAQLKSVEYQKAQAKNSARSGKAYFNYLLNRSYDSRIDEDELAKTVTERISIEQAISIALNNRLEIDQAQSSVMIMDHQISLVKGEFLPKVSVVADYGIQGTKYQFGDDSDFYQGSAVLTWNIFNRSYQVEKEAIEVEKKQRGIQKKDIEKQISLQVIQAYNTVQTALENLELVAAEESTAAEAFRLVNKKYLLGRANQVEFTDARVRFTSAQQKRVITLYDYWITKAALDTAMGYSRGSNQ